MFDIKNIDDNFKIPIEYNENKKNISESLQEDLELKDNENTVSLYNHVYNPNSKFGKKIIEKYANFYTDDTTFLKNTQNLIRKSDNFIINKNNDEIYELWNDIKNDKGFLDRYQYVDIDYFKVLNSNAFFLQILSMVNMSSPVISLTFPIVMLILPFFLIKLQDSTVTINNYLKFLKIVIVQNSIGNLIINFNSVPLDKKIYLALSAGFYIFQIYQSILACRRFYLNLTKIHNDIFMMRNFIEITVKNIDIHINTMSHESYSEFNKQLLINKENLNTLHTQLSSITPYKLNYNKAKNIGYLMKCFYDIYDNKIFNDSMLFAFGFMGYIETLNGINRNIKDRKLNCCKYITNKETTFKNSYYAPFKNNENAVVNSYSLENNKLITGPNASGKTTLLKTTLFNIILSQQNGFGFYTSANINPYKYIHCYLNIPDTSGRDSLFQAEARRCKEILDSVMNSEDRHFCIFDEIYSGTNPYEAISGAYAYLQFLSRYKNFKFMLTTHYVSLCEKVNTIKNITNCHMNIKIDENKEFLYTYKLKKGISTTKGGVKVFKDLKYPKEIINKMQENIQNAI